MSAQQLSTRAPVCACVRRRVAARCSAAPTPRSRCAAGQPQRSVGADAALQLVAAALALSVLVPASNAEVRLPPIDQDPLRCERGFTGNTIGQANAVSDKLLDMRGCKYDGKSLMGRVLSGALMVDASFVKTDLSEVVMSKAYAVKADFTGASFKNAVLDRVIFDGSSMKGVSFVNAVITGSSFVDVDLTDATFEDANVGQEDAKRLCANPTVVGQTRFEVGCRS